MSRLRMTKAVLTGLRRDLALYQRALPSLELKRRQLLAELTEARAACDGLDVRLATLEKDAARIVPAADAAVPLDGLVIIRQVIETHQARLGLMLPVLQDIEWQVADHSLVATPPWVDGVVEIVRAIAAAIVERRIAARRVAMLRDALAGTIQRINLLEQRLMPEARRDIARISVFLADGDRAAIARAKLVMRRRGVGAEVSA